MKITTIISYLLKIIAYSLCALGCFYQVVSILNLYFSFPTTVFSLIEIMNTLELPAISICTNNRVMLSKIREIDSRFDQMWTKLSDISNLTKSKSSTTINLNRTRMLKQRLINKTIRKLMDTLPIYSFSQLGHQWTDILANDYFKCATDAFNLDKKCVTYSNVIVSAQEVGNCFTIFRRWENITLKNIAIKSGISQSPVIRGIEDSLNLEISDQPFHPNELFRIMINFSIDERTTLNEKTMGHIIIHDENELPSIRNENFIIYPGYYYEFFISKETGKYLQYPYITDCREYKLKIKNEQKDEYIQVLSRESCIMNCMAKNTIERCQCWPPELPFIIDNSNSTLKWCSWRDGTNINVNSSKTRNWFKYCFANYESKCQSQCKIRCKIDNFEVVKQTVIWPSKERIDHSKKYNTSFRQCCTLISIKFWSNEQSIQDYQPKYEFVEFISYFGGLLSMWLGFSLVKTYDIGEIVVRKIIVYMWEYKQPRQAKTEPIQVHNDYNGQYLHKEFGGNNKRQINRPKVSKYFNQD